MELISNDKSLLDKAIYGSEHFSSTVSKAVEAARQLWLPKDETFEEDSTSPTTDKILAALGQIYNVSPFRASPKPPVPSRTRHVTRDAGNLVDWGGTASLSGTASLTFGMNRNIKLTVEPFHTTESTLPMLNTQVTSKPAQTMRFVIQSGMFDSTYPFMINASDRDYMVVIDVLIEYTQCGRPVKYGSPYKNKVRMPEIPALCAVRELSAEYNFTHSKTTYTKNTMLTRMAHLTSNQVDNFLEAFNGKQTIESYTTNTNGEISKLSQIKTCLEELDKTFPMSMSSKEATMDIHNVAYMKDNDIHNPGEWLKKTVYEIGPNSPKYNHEMVELIIPIPDFTFMSPEHSEASSSFGVTVKTYHLSLEQHNKMFILVPGETCITFNVQTLLVMSKGSQSQVKLNHTLVIPFIGSGSKVVGGNISKGQIDNKYAELSGTLSKVIQSAVTYDIVDVPRSLTLDYAPTVTDASHPMSIHGMVTSHSIITVTQDKGDNLTTHEGDSWWRAGQKSVQPNIVTNTWISSHGELPKCINQEDFHNALSNDPKITNLLMSGGYADEDYGTLVMMNPMSLRCYNIHQVFNGYTVQALPIVENLTQGFSTSAFLATYSGCLLKANEITHEGGKNFFMKGRYLIEYAFRGGDPKACKAAGPNLSRAPATNTNLQFKGRTSSSTHPIRVTNTQMSANIMRTDESSQYHAMT